MTRHDPKNFRQWRPDGKGGWIPNLDSVRLVPYRLSRLIEAIGNEQMVLVVEGEHDVHTAEALGLVATTNAMGAGKWRDEFDKHFAGADVVIIPDNDPQSVNKKTGEKLFHPDGRPRFPGLDHAIDVAAHLQKVAACVRILRLPAKDLTAWIEQGRTREELDALIAAAPEFIPGGPPPEAFDPGGGYGVEDLVEESDDDERIPLFPPLPPEVLFPIEALGPVLAAGAAAITRKIQVQAAVAAQSVLAAAALVAQVHADVVLPYGQKRPLSLFFTTIVLSGDRKTSADKEALWSIRKHERKLKEIFEEEIGEHRASLAAYNAEKRKIEADKKLDRQARQQQLRDSW